jgi:hypothetical protein
MIMLGLGISALFVNWLVSFPVAAQPVLHPILLTFGIVFTVLGVALITEDRIREYHDRRKPPTPPVGGHGV